MVGSQEPNITKTAVKHGSFYYNAPNHLIITSPFYSGRTVGGPAYELDEETPEKLELKRLQLERWAANREAKRRIREEESEKRRAINAEYRRLASIAAKAKAIAEAAARPRVTRTPKCGVMLDTTPKRENTGWTKAYPPNPYTGKRSERHREKEKIEAQKRRDMAHREEIAALPDGYVRAETIQVVSTTHAVKVALRTGLVSGIKVGIKWYCNADELIEYCIKVEQKRLAGLAATRAKILEARRAKAHDKRKVSTIKGDSV